MYIQCTNVSQTGKALAVEYDNQIRWIPLSLIRNRKEDKANSVTYLDVEDWFYRKLINENDN